jgi:hypothetical protein
MHWGTVHDPTGPADELFLQAPNTASCGRKLTTEILGGWHGSLLFGGLFSSSINLLRIERPLHIQHNLRSKLRIGCSGWEATPAGSTIRRR